jgi:microcin C transport system substrate-binding protein
MIFNLRPEAHYDDGVAITAQDYKYAFDTNREHGSPILKSFYEDFEGLEVLDDLRIKFTFKTRNNMKPLIKAAGLSPEPKHFWDKRSDLDIAETYLESPPSSSAYRVTKVEPGRSITYERVDNYWGKDLQVNIGTANIDRIRYDYYRDFEVMLEAFKAGEVDFRQENSAKRWSTAYKLPQVDNGQIIVTTIPDNEPQGIQGYFFNLRRPQFQDIRVREALGYLYDFEAIQRTIYYGQYKRTKSFFPNSDFGADGAPTAQELAILEPYKDQLDPRILEKAFEPPQTDGSGRNREQVRQALQLFREAGWELKDSKLMKDGKQMKIEFLLVQPDMERVVAPYQQNLQRAGIDASIRIVDSSQYRVRLDDFDFDIITVRSNFFPPPGPELRSYYGSAAADVRGSANWPGIKNPVVDALIEQIIAAKDLDTLKATTRAMDRVLLWNFYVIPQLHNDTFRVAYWNKFGHPDKFPRYGTGFSGTWWIDAALAAKLPKR